MALLSYVEGTLPNPGGYILIGTKCENGHAQCIGKKSIADCGVGKRNQRTFFFIRYNNGISMSDMTVV